MIKIFKKKINKKWTAITVVILGLFWKVKAASAAFFLPALGIALGAELISWYFGVSITSMTLSAVIGGLITILIKLVGLVLTVFIWILFQAAKYNDFIREPIVVQGWRVVRDLSNMFFILVLLIIAFATILRLPNYEWKKLLPKLLIMAVLINFSRTIVGLAIDFSQVVTYAFLSPLGNAGPGNIATTFGIEKLFNFSTGFKDPNVKENAVNALNTTSSLLLGLIMLIIACVVVMIMALILVFRIIMLWILIILSPLAFLAMAVPAGAKYASQWTSELTKYLIVGPVIAFFLWLALLSGGNSKIGVDLSDKNIPDAGISEISTGNNMVKYIVACGLFLGALMAAQQAGTMGAGMAGGAMNKLKATGLGIGKFGLFKAGRGLDTAQMKVQKFLSGGEKSDYRPKSLNYRVIAEGWKRKQAKDLEKYEDKYGGLTNVWHDNFNNYARLNQWAAVKMSPKKIGEANAEARKLTYLQTRIDQRLGDSELTQPEKDKKFLKHREDEDKIKQKYREAGFSEEEAQREYDNDADALLGDTPIGEVFDPVKAKKERDELEKKINSLEDIRYRLFGKVPLGLPGIKAKQKAWTYSEAGTKEAQDKEQKDMEQRTGGKDFAVINELLNARANGEHNKVVAAMKILAKNNDLNEAMKDPRMIRLMTKENGIMDNLAKRLEKTNPAILANLESIKRNIKKAPVSPANVQAMVQGMLLDMGIGENMAGREASEIGTISIQNGNTLAFGMSYGDTATGKFKFSNYQIGRKGQLVSGEGRIQAMIGKLANMGSQELMRTWHPDCVIVEAPDGSGAGLSEEGERTVAKLTTQHLTQVNRQRIDMINKTGGAEEVLKEAKELYRRLMQGSAKDRQDAEIIRVYFGYSKKKFEGQDIAQENMLRGSDAAFDSIPD